MLISRDAACSGRKAPLPLEHPDRRVLGIIRPSAEALADYPRERGVALWATEGTVKSGSFALELEKLAPGLRLIQKACPLLVPLVEAGRIERDRDRILPRQVLARDPRLARAAAPQAGPFGRYRRSASGLHPLSSSYPLIRSRLPPEIDILVQGDIVAPSLADYLARHPEIESALSRGGTQRFLTTDQTEGFDRLSEVFLGHRVVSERVEI